jgi:uncharacterized protein (DUF1778 family)
LFHFPGQRFGQTLAGGHAILALEERSHVPTPTARTEKIDLQLAAAAKSTSAAAADRRSVSDFVLDSAPARAEETLALRRHLGLDATQWTAFIAALDAPARPLPNVETLFRQASVFEGGVQK